MYMRLPSFVVCAAFVVFGSSCHKSNENSVTVGPVASPDDTKAATVRDSETSETPKVSAPLNEAKTKAISALWDDPNNEWGEFESNNRAHGNVVTIKYRIFANPDQKTKKKAAVVISSGRTECMFKYDETIYDLYQKGYSVYIHDHRGQGFSGSTIRNQNLPPEEGHGPGHVNDFAFYVEDLHHFVTDVVQPSQHDLTESDQNLLLLGHSMGGCIASRYIEEHPTVFRAAVLCSPMHEPDAGLLPGVAAELINDILATKGDERYAGRGGPNENKEFDEKTAKKEALTHSKERHDHIRNMFSDAPETLVGGASTGWVQLAFRAARDSIAKAAKIEVDVLLLQATEDIAVTPKGQFKFRDTLNAAHPGRCELVPIKGAYHELLIESDTIRNKAMGAILKFFDEHAVGTRS